MTKQSTGEFDSDLLKPTVDDIKMMVAYEHKKDKALGLRLSKHTRGLVWYGEEKVRQIAKLAVTKGAMNKIQSRMKEIMREVETSQPERKRELLAEARMLQKAARRVSKNGY